MTTTVSARPIGARAGAATVNRQPLFVSLLAVELLARTGYQAGKSPLLPLCAAALGAARRSSVWWSRRRRSPA